MAGLVGPGMTFLVLQENAWMARTTMKLWQLSART